MFPTNAISFEISTFEVGAFLNFLDSGTEDVCKEWEALAGDPDKLHAWLPHEGGKRKSKTLAQATWQPDAMFYFFTGGGGGGLKMMMDDMIMSTPP